MPSSYDSYHGSSYHSSANSSYMNNAARTYYTRLSEKAAPPGTVHFHSNTESHYHQPAHYVRVPTTKVVQKVVHVREPAPPTHVIREKVIVREPVRQPPREVGYQNEHATEETAFARCGECKRAEELAIDLI
ncbi:hypothetical protein GRF29_8g611584 [Pseudopithomyces chartarum]|uniref:Uncharacterized protein n=1 Tax=Pseudopithomyces chartarum TaxID=1892770 RepID=A0AAN6M5K8_9PLEO|nr:hypothetical protein GRF29_8g611584 [Pseudopithomyces chartarum]